MKSKHLLLKSLTAFGVICLLFQPSALAEREIVYDPYASEWKFPEAHRPGVAVRRDRRLVMLRILEQPFRPFGYGAGKTAELVERKHIDRKAIWMLDELALRGIYPAAMTPTEGGLGIMGPGGRIDIEKLVGIEQPYFSLEGSGGFTPNRGFVGTSVEAGGSYKIESPRYPVYHQGTFQYRRSSSESFYGIGQDTSLGDSTSYQPEQIRIDASFGYEPTTFIKTAAAFIYEKTNIGNGSREDVGRIKSYFPPGSIPGVMGADLFGVSANLERDGRDHPGDPKQGSLQQFRLSYFHEADRSDFHYIKLTGSTAHFVSLGSDRRVLAVRIAGEKNEELGDGEIPFYHLARLGGSDIGDGSELLRSYRFNRFFDEGLVLANAEYRYSVYEYGDFAADAVALVDVGEVFEELGDFGFDELKFSYGGGFNVKFRRNTVLSFIAASGNEGPRIATHTSVSF